VGIFSRLSRISSLINARGRFYGQIEGQKEIFVSKGIVKWFNRTKGFGFISPEGGGEDLFVHHTEVKMSGYANLDEGQQVEFEVGQGKKGPCATNVTLC
jgi:CspA family cold shock protein